MRYIALAFKITHNNIYAHSDSLVSLHWILKDVNGQKTYVVNHVKKIQDEHIKILFVQGNKIQLISAANLNQEKTMSTTHFGPMALFIFKKLTILGSEKKSSNT